MSLFPKAPFGLSACPSMSLASLRLRSPATRHGEQAFGNSAGGLTFEFNSAFSFPQRCEVGAGRVNSFAPRGSPILAFSFPQLRQLRAGGYGRLHVLHRNPSSGSCALCSPQTRHGVGRPSSVSREPSVS